MGVRAAGERSKISRGCRATYSKDTQSSNDRGFYYKSQMQSPLDSSQVTSCRSARIVFVCIMTIRNMKSQ